MINAIRKNNRVIGGVTDTWRNLGWWGWMGRISGLRSKSWARVWMVMEELRVTGKWQGKAGQIGYQAGEQLESSPWVEAGVGAGPTGGSERPVRLEFREWVGDGEIREVWDRGQIMKGLVDHKEDFELHSKCEGRETLRGLSREGTWSNLCF